MTNQHPITPPPELVRQWYDACILEGAITYDEYKFAAFAAQWGADQELEACCEWITGQDWTWTSSQLRAARRPKPPSLKQQALAALEDDEIDVYLIRRALEALPE